MSNSFIWSALCNVARPTVDPSINTGSNTAVGVTTPVRPTLNSTSIIFVTASVAGNLYAVAQRGVLRSEEHTSELQSRFDLVCRLLLEKKKNTTDTAYREYQRTTTT